MAGVGGMFGAADRATMPISSGAIKTEAQSLPKRRSVNINPDSTSSTKKRTKTIRKPRTEENPGKKQIRKKTKVPINKKKVTKKSSKRKLPIDIFT